MALAPALRAAIRVLRGRPADLLPAFLLTPAVATVVRVVSLAGLGTAYASLAVTGRLQTFRTDLADGDLDPPDPNAEPDAFAEWVDEFVPLLETLVTPTTVAILLVTGVASILLFVVLSAAVTAAQLAACRATLDAVRGGSRFVRSRPVEPSVTRCSRWPSSAPSPSSPRSRRRPAASWSGSRASSWSPPPSR